MVSVSAARSTSEVKHLTDTSVPAADRFCNLELYLLRQWMNRHANSRFWSATIGKIIAKAANGRGSARKNRRVTSFRDEVDARSTEAAHWQKLQTETAPEQPSSAPPPAGAAWH